MNKIGGPWAEMTATWMKKLCNYEACDPVKEGRDRRSEPFISPLGLTITPALSA